MGRCFLIAQTLFFSVCSLAIVCYWRLSPTCKHFLAFPALLELQVETSSREIHKILETEMIPAIMDLRAKQQALRTGFSQESKLAELIEGGLNFLTELQSMTTSMQQVGVQTSAFVANLVRNRIPWKQISAASYYLLL